MKTWLAALLVLATASCAPTECQRADWEDWGPDEPTDLGYTPREAAEHFTITETITVTDAAGMAHALRIEVVVSPDLASYAEYVNEGDMFGDVTCSAGELSAGHMDVYVSTDDGFFDDRFIGELRVEGPLSESAVLVATNSRFYTSDGSWYPPGGPFGRYKYFDIALEGGVAGARVAYFEAGGLTDCSVKGGCSRRIPEMTYTAP